MSIFNEEQLKAMFSREYICHECGHLMEFEDEWEDTLVCPHCGHSIDLDDYGREGNEEYENLYPTREEVLGRGRFVADGLFIFTSQIQGIFRQPVWRVYGRIISNRHYKTNNVGIKNETNPTSAMGNLL